MIVEHVAFHVSVAVKLKMTACLAISFSVMTEQQESIQQVFHCIKKEAYRECSERNGEKKSLICDEFHCMNYATSTTLRFPLNKAHLK